MLLMTCALFCARGGRAVGPRLPDCLTNKVVIVDAASGSTSSKTEENLGFWIDETAKSVTLADGTPLIIRRFDDRWISATRGEVAYELPRAGWSPSTSNRN